MNNSSILRFGGIAALASAVLYIASMGLWMSAGTVSSPTLATTAYIVSQVAFLVTLYALFVIHRDEAPLLAPAGIGVLAISIGASLFIDPTDMANPLLLVLTICYGVGGIIVGVLAYRSPQLTRGMGIAAMVTGGLSLLMAPFILMGMGELVGLLNLGVSIPYLIWIVWLGLHLAQGRVGVLQAR